MTNTFLYTVRPGDTLWSIAQRFGTTVEAIKSLNNLTSDEIFPGQQLLIPGGGCPCDTFVYIVQPGDTLWSIAQRFNTTVDIIKSLNNLTSDMIYPGQRLLIPRSGLPPTPPFPPFPPFPPCPPGPRPCPPPCPPPVPPCPPPTPPCPGNVYIVKSGDSLWKIARAHGTTVEAIKALNGLCSDLIFPGQRLLLPANSGNGNGCGCNCGGGGSGGTYVVRSGDSLWKIARAHGTTVEALKRANGLCSDMIYPGQVLRIPGGC